MIKTWNENQVGSERMCAGEGGTHLIVVRTEILEMAEAGVADADKDGDGQSYQCKQRRGGPEAWEKGNKEGRL